jgi:hypothetical protein
MAESTLTTTTATGSQTTTQSPQTSAAATNFGGQQSSGVQPGTARDLLNSTNGIPLASSPVTTVNLANAAQQTVTTTQVPKEQHHVNPALMGFSVLLFLVAIVLFWNTSRSVKNTT